MLTVMGMAARPLGVEITGATASVEKEMASAPVRMIRALRVTIRIPGKVSNEQRQKLEQAALSCPVHQSLHADVRMPVEFIWDLVA